jgi:hypothetical protein
VDFRSIPYRTRLPRGCFIGCNTRTQRRSHRRYHGYRQHLVETVDWVPPQLRTWGRCIPPPVHPTWMATPSTRSLRTLSPQQWVVRVLERIWSPCCGNMPHRHRLSMPGLRRSRLGRSRQGLERWTCVHLTSTNQRLQKQRPRRTALESHPLRDPLKTYHASNKRPNAATFHTAN